MTELTIIKEESDKPISMYDVYSKCLSKYSKWIKEQIENNKNGFIRVRRDDIGSAMKKELAIIMGKNYRDKTYNSLYKIIRVILFNDGITTILAYYENRERVFVFKKRKANDILIPSLQETEEKLKLMSVSSEIRKNMGIN